MKMIRYYYTNGNQKIVVHYNAKIIYGLCLKLNYNRGHDVLKKFGLDPNLVQEATGPE